MVIHDCGLLFGPLCITAKSITIKKMWPKHAQQTTETLNNSARKCYYRQLYMWSNEQHSIKATLMLAKTYILALQYMYFAVVWWNNENVECRDWFNTL